MKGSRAGGRSRLRWNAPTAHLKAQLKKRGAKLFPSAGTWGGAPGPLGTRSVVTKQTADTRAAMLALMLEAMARPGWIVDTTLGMMSLIALHRTEIRYHIWHPKLRLKGRPQHARYIHDHGDHLISHVVVGSVRHREVRYRAAKDGDWNIWSLGLERLPDPGERLSSALQWLKFKKESDKRFEIFDGPVERFREGYSYRMPPLMFHDPVILEPAATIVTRLPTRYSAPRNARRLVEVGAEESFPLYKPDGVESGMLRGRADQVEGLTKKRYQKLCGGHTVEAVQKEMLEMLRKEGKLK